MAAKYPCGVLLQKNYSLVELGHPSCIYSLFDGRLGLLQIRDCRWGLRLEKTIGLDSVWERTQN